MLYLIRHTKPDVKPGTCYGQTDLDVADSFSVEAETAITKLGDISNFKIFSSPLIRCMKLAKAIAPTNSNITSDKRLMELNFGRWEKREWKHIPAWEMELWGENYITNSVHGGETFMELKDRVDKFREEIDLNKDTVVVAHDGVIRAFLTHFLDLKSDKIFTIELPYASVVKITPVDKSFNKVRFL